MVSKKTPSPVIKLVDTNGNRLFIVTDRIVGNINGKTIKAERGEKLYLTSDAAKIFKDRILEI